MLDKTLYLAPARELDTDKLREFAVSLWGDGSWDKIRQRWWLKSDYAAAVTAVERASGRVAGMCVGVPSEWTLPDGSDVKAVSICGWYVAPDFEGKGVGKMLVRSYEADTDGFNALSISDAAVRNFAKMGWVGPYSTWLRLLPSPLICRRMDRRADRFSLRAFQASAHHLPMDLATALDQIDREKPPFQLRRKRRAQDWRAFLRACPERRLQFHLVLDHGRPVGYFVIRSTDREAGRLYRLSRLHYISDLVINSSESELIHFIFGSMPKVAPASAGALLFCASSKLIADAASAAGWLNEQSMVLGEILAAKAPRYMLGGRFAPFAATDVRLSFVDADVDLNI
jgi:hypothetical protein